MAALEQLINFTAKRVKTYATTHFAFLLQFFFFKLYLTVISRMSFLLSILCTFLTYKQIKSILVPGCNATKCGQSSRGGEYLCKAAQGDIRLDSNRDIPDSKLAHA